MNTFRTGDIAELMGATKMGVHYLEKHGYLTADREQNGYRVYSLSTLTRMAAIKSYERMGFPLKESNVMLDMPVSQIHAVLLERKRQIEEQLAMVEWQLANADPEGLVADRITDDNSRIEMSPPMYYCPVWEEIYDMEHLDSRVARRMREIDISWIAAMPYMQFCSRITREDSGIRFEKGNCIWEPYADGVRIDEYVTRVEPALCLTFRTAFCDTDSILSMAEDYLAAKRLRMRFPIYAPIRIFSNRSCEEDGIIQFFIPIEDM